MDSAAVGISVGPSETVLGPAPDAWTAALDEALAVAPGERRAALSTVAARYPAFVAVWTELARSGVGAVEAYAYARVGYHRGLDALRASGWKGTGYLRWAEPTNRSSLEAIEALRVCAETLGETDEEERCARFIRQLDPSRLTGPGHDG